MEIQVAQRNPPIRSRKYLGAARGQSCIRCGRNDGTVVAAHYSGLYAGSLGKGVSQKVHDFCVADLCLACHKEFDQYDGGNMDERAAEFFKCILLTIERRWREGVLCIR